MGTELRRTFHAETRPRIVCLCGSGRFYAEFQQADYDLTLAGEIVLSIGFPHGAGEASRQRIRSRIGVRPAEGLGG